MIFNCIYSGVNGSSNTLYLNGKEYKYSYKEHLNVPIAQSGNSTDINITTYDSEHLSFQHPVTNMVYSITDQFVLKVWMMSGSGGYFQDFHTVAPVSSDKIGMAIPETGRQSLFSITKYETKNNKYYGNITCIITKTYLCTIRSTNDPYFDKDKDLRIFTDDTNITVPLTIYYS